MVAYSEHMMAAHLGCLRAVHWDNWLADSKVALMAEHWVSYSVEMLVLQKGERKVVQLDCQLEMQKIGWWV